MSSIQLSNVRIAGFRGLEDVCLNLSKTTVLTGCNNSGKTSILKALQLALGNSNFLTPEDIFISPSGKRADKIIVDVKFVPVDDEGKIAREFSDEWSAIFKATYFEVLGDGSQSFSFRTEFTYSKIKSEFDKETRIIPTWEPSANEQWQNIRTASKLSLDRDSIPFFYIEAQRDIVEDSKSRTSFLGKILAKVSKSYSEEDIINLEQQIKSLNESAITKSNVLSDLEEILKGIESALESNESKVKITPFTKKIRDLNKGLSIQYGSEDNSFTMDYHGMGTRSWSSLLAFKAFILQSKNAAEKEEKVFHPIITVEEPEAHLHPDAQKRLYSQINEIPGQKIISTHSPYVAAYAKLNEIRNVYKKDVPIVSSIDTSSFSDEDIRRLEYKVIKTKGEIIYSKAIVLFEGETEEQALPILATKFFQNDPTMLGIDFISVGGCGNYLPFLRLAKAFNIPWYIFSDGEPRTVNLVTKAIADLINEHSSNINLANYDNVFIIKNNADFEKMLIDDGYIHEIKTALEKTTNDKECITTFINGRNGQIKKAKQTCPHCKQVIREEIRYNYVLPNDQNEILDEMMADKKTSFAPEIADILKSSPKGLPPLVEALFKKINQDMSL